MEEEVTYIDPEFQINGTDKIDFKTILFKQIDYIRFLRTQDMGELMLFGVNIFTYKKTDTFFTWVANNQKFQNGVKSLQSLMRTYHDDIYKDDLKSIEKKYKNKLYEELLSIKKECQRNNKTEQEYLDKVNEAKKSFALVQTTYKYDDIFEVTIELIKRAKFIGGNDYISEVI